MVELISTGFELKLAFVSFEPKIIIKSMGLIAVEL